MEMEYFFFNSSNVIWTLDSTVYTSGCYIQGVSKECSHLIKYRKIRTTRTSSWKDNPVSKIMK